MKLQNTKALVKSILEQDQKARNSDSYLYLRILKHIANETGADFEKIPVTEFLQRMDFLGVPPFESVRRSRQKVQAECPELAANDVVQVYRAENEEVYRDFARS